MFGITLTLEGGAVPPEAQSPPGPSSSLRGPGPTFPPRLRGREVGGVEKVRLDAPGGRLASFSDSLEISRVWPPSEYRIVDPVAEAVGKDSVVDALTAPIAL